MSIKGKCLCGKVRYEITGRLYNVSHCHCSMYRRHHGAAFTSMLVVCVAPHHKQSVSCIYVRHFDECMKALEFKS